ncbi:hypothetical protein [Vulcanisaeta distributa]|uniref:hypothetical protein n=1 Tax=Vulcanisaeta distributa TaxID=164451 RepID=UPI0006D12E2D|nr:hypothetical protein [Vulcanisaeta distributa]
MYLRNWSIIATITLLMVIIITIYLFYLTHTFTLTITERFTNQAVATNIISEQALINIDVPIYVVGPSTLVQELMGLGINQSLIKPITISELQNLPNNSLVIIDWSVMKPLLYLINGTGINATSPAINTLVNLLKRGDLVLVSVNRGGSLPIAELVLTYSLARTGDVKVSGFTNVNSFPYPISQYLIAYPVMPITINYTLIAGFVYRRGGVMALIVGPLSMHDMPGLVIAWLMSTGRYGMVTAPLSISDPGYENTDPLLRILAKPIKRTK